MASASPRAAASAYAETALFGSGRRAAPQPKAGASARRKAAERSTGRRVVQKPFASLPQRGHLGAQPGKEGGGVGGALHHLPLRVGIAEVVDEGVGDRLI